MKKKDDQLFFNYLFSFSTHQQVRLDIKLDAKDLSYRPPQLATPPDWTRLENDQCKNCRLKPEDSPHCPIALNLANIIPHFREYVSYDRVHVLVETRERTYEKETSVQQALGSLLGIIMVTSGCPTMHVLTPMVRFHLPFASIEETIFRSVSSYLLGQYFRLHNGLQPDWELSGLLHSYEDIQVLNVGMTNRLRKVSDTDANANAVIVLDVFAKELPFSIFESLKKLEYLYSDFLNESQRED